MIDDQSWNFQHPSSRARILALIRREADEMFELAGEPDRWHLPTACAGWEVRDMIGHLLDATDSYLAGFDLSRRGGAPPESVGVAGMAEASDEAARAFRGTPRHELLSLLREKTDKLIEAFESIS